MTNFETYFRACFKTDSKIDSKTDKHHQVVLSNWLRRIILRQILPLFLPTIYVMVPQHGPFSLHTILEGP